MIGFTVLTILFNMSKDSFLSKLSREIIRMMKKYRVLEIYEWEKVKSLDFVKKGKKSLMMPDIDSDIYTKVVDPEKSFILYVYCMSVTIGNCQKKQKTR